MPTNLLPEYVAPSWMGLLPDIKRHKAGWRWWEIGMTWWAIQLLRILSVAKKIVMPPT